MARLSASREASARFDRTWRADGRLLRLPQEDLCQALSVPSSRKYQDKGGPGVLQIMERLQEADDPARDRAAFFRSQILFWLIGATDGHAKNFSLFLRPGGRFELTPFYDVLTAQPGFDRKQIRHREYRLAMSVGARAHYRIDEVLGRHFVESGKAAGLGPTLMRREIDEVRAAAQEAPERALGEMPADFHPEAHEAITAILPSVWRCSRRRTRRFDPGAPVETYQISIGAEPERSPLTGGTPEGRPPRLHRTPHDAGAAVAGAGPALAAVDVEAMLEIALAALGVGEISQGRAARGYGVVEDVANLGREGLKARFRDLPGRHEG